MIESMRYKSDDGRRTAIICRPVTGDGWELHLLRWDDKREPAVNRRTRRKAPKLTAAQQIARRWVA